MATAVDVAKTLIRLAADDPDGEPMTPLRLQKLLYYCQGWHLAWYGRPLFPDRLEAWKNGPVVPDVWEQPWGKGKQPITDPGGEVRLSATERAVVEQVWGQFRRYSAIGLRDLTHNEAPWRQHFEPDDGGRCSTEIPVGELAAFFGDEYHRLTGDEPGQADRPNGPTVPLDQLRKDLGW